MSPPIWMEKVQVRRLHAGSKDRDCLTVLHGVGSLWATVSMRGIPLVSVRLSKSGQVIFGITVVSITDATPLNRGVRLRVGMWIRGGGIPSIPIRWQSGHTASPLITTEGRDSVVGRIIVCS